MSLQSISAIQARKPIFKQLHTTQRRLFPSQLAQSMQHICIRF